MVCMTHTDKLKDLIISAGLVPTRARLEILSICMKTKIPVDVMHVANKLGDSTHLATIYRTLEKFASLGILTRVDFQEGKFRYEYVHDHHHHAVCESCGSIAEVKDHHLEKAMNAVKVGAGFSVTRHALELFGLCQGCQPKGSHVKRTS